MNMIIALNAMKTFQEFFKIILAYAKMVIFQLIILYNANLVIIHASNVKITFHVLRVQITTLLLEYTIQIYKIAFAKKGILNNQLLMIKYVENANKPVIYVRILIIVQNAISIL